MPDLGGASIKDYRGLKTSPLLHLLSCPLAEVVSRGDSFTPKPDSKLIHFDFSSHVGERPFFDLPFAIHHTNPVSIESTFLTTFNS